jgi:AcrR family transcriptional regulator
MLLDGALQLIRDSGPEALTTRKLADAVGTSTMAVYTEFGSLPGLVSAVVDAGFSKLAAMLAQVSVTDDPVADLWSVVQAYRSAAHEEPALYGVMFGTTALGGYRRQGSELLQGLHTFRVNVEFVTRAIEAERFRHVEAWPAAVMIWQWLHGVVSSELAGFDVAIRGFAPAYDSDIVARRSFIAIVVGLGDRPDRAHASIDDPVAKAKRRPAGARRSGR